VSLVSEREGLSLRRVGLLGMCPQPSSWLGVCVVGLAFLY
jgi:hypothetical protein